MGDLPYDTVLVGTVANRHDGTVEVSHREGRRRRMREETRVGGALVDVQHYDDVVMETRTATFETKKVDVLFENGARLRMEGRRLLDGDVVLFARHRGSGGDVDDVFDVRRHEWHFCGVDRAPPVGRLAMALAAIATALCMRAAGSDIAAIAQGAAVAGLTAAIIDRLLVGWRKISLGRSQARTGAEMRRILQRAADAAA